jgi:hypothetical protein
MEAADNCFESAPVRGSIVAPHTTSYKRVPISSPKGPQTDRLASGMQTTANELDPFSRISELLSTGS